MNNTEKMMRRTGLTAIEAVGLAGLSPMTPLQIYRRKMAPKSPLKHDVRAVLAAYEKRTGRVVVRRPMFRNPLQRFAVAEAGYASRLNINASRGDFSWTDRLLIPIRLKCSPWTALPPSLAATAQWELGATGLVEADVVVLFGVNRWWQELRFFQVVFDGPTFARFYGFAEHLMSEHVLQKIPPPKPGALPVVDAMTERGRSDTEHHWNNALVRLRHRLHQPKNRSRR